MAEDKVSILVVDDLPEKHVVFATILEDLGLDIVSASSGKEALARVLEREFAVILLDVNMPDIDGLETAGLIRQYKKSAQTPIVFISAYVDEEQAARGYELGAVDYIPSPVVPGVLRSKVRVFVELFRMNRQLQAQAKEREQLARAEAARAAAEEAIHRADYLSEASQQLSRSLNIEDTIAQLFDVAVPMLGDRAILVLANADGGVARVEAYPARPGAYEELPPSLVHALTRVTAGRHFELWRDEDEAAALCPLLGGGRLRGVLILFDDASRMDPSRQALAKEVVSRASIAMENARLYSAVQEADRRKNEFLAMLAHELRNPLAPIRNAVHIMQAGDATPATMTWARDVIGRQADHMARLIDDLLDVSRIVQGKVTVKPEKLSLAAIIERTVEATAPRTQAREQHVIVTLPQEGIEVNGDAVRLSQVLSNLINNASKFSAPGTTIRLSAAYADREVRISVKDEGAGIAPEFLPHIFDLFVQGDQSLDRAQGGLGIGLTLVKHLVELHAGRVSAFSEGPGHGTEIVVHLPARIAAAAPGAIPVPASAPRVAQPRANAPARILVVDDLAASAETLTMLLEMEGFEVKTAHEGMTALKIAEDFQPDVVLLDIGLPGMNGFEVAHRLRSLPAARDALLIALTGYGEAESRSRSVQAGFDFHMVKPADVNLLLGMLADPRNSRKAAA